MKEFKNNLIFHIRWYAKEINQFLIFITKIKGLWKLYRDYEYDGETLEFIIENYQEVLCNCTKTMSYPTYYSKDVIAQIREYFEGDDYEK